MSSKSAFFAFFDALIRLTSGQSYLDLVTEVKVLRNRIDELNRARFETHAAAEELLRRNKELSLKVRLLEEASYIDPLTGALNRRGFDKRFAEWFAHARRQQKPNIGALALIDVDHFKKINDTHGHHAGDEVLATLARIIRKSIRTEDLFLRYGGEEFVIFMPDTESKEAASSVERLRLSIEQTTLSIGDEMIRKIRFTISAGIALVRSKESDTAEEAFKRGFEDADRRLYIAKDSGRNRVCFFDPVARI